VRRSGAGQLAFNFAEPPPPPTWAAHDALAARAARASRDALTERAARERREEFARVVAAADAEVELRAAHPERLGAHAATSDATGASGAPPATTARAPLPPPQQLLLLGMHRTTAPAVRATMPLDAPAASWAAAGVGAEAYDAAPAPPGVWRPRRSGDRDCDGNAAFAFASVKTPPGTRREAILAASPRDGEAVAARNPLRVVPPPRGPSGGRAAAAGAEAGDESGDDDSGAGSGTDARARVAASAAAGLCVICLTAPASHVCVPCGHQCGCGECLEIVRLASRQCPLCRARIATVVRVFAAGASS
jgi:hypothetical protein